MKVTKTSLEGFLAIELDIYEDDRGFFLETYQEERYHQAGITDEFVQDNHSRSLNGVLRGMHFQLKRPQSQIVTVMRGEIFDVAVDLRKESETFGQWHGVNLGENSKARQVYMKPGFAHGFLVLSDFADLHYKVSNAYDPADEAGLLWSDSSIGIKWPKDGFIVNQRDSNFPVLDEILPLL